MLFQEQVLLLSSGVCVFMNEQLIDQEKAYPTGINTASEHIIYRTDGRAIALCGRAETQQIRHLRDIILVPQMLFLELIE